MCGIAGFVGRSLMTPDQDKISQAKASLFLRGPDGSGTYQKKIGNKTILFIHTRLSIVDLNKNANQPFNDNEGSLIFNGMIYNYIELRNKLKRKGIKFETKSDTEVLLKMLNLYKEKALKYLDGMWVFAYHNFKTNTVIISRDRFGEKPLYFYNSKNNFYFSNSIKALVKLIKKKLEINETALLLHLNYPDKSVGELNQTIFKNIYKFPESSFFKFNLENKKITKKKFWNLKISNKKISFPKSCKRLKEMIKYTIKTRTRSDVKNCMLISGGLDSNAIASYAKENGMIEGYTLKSPIKSYDESKFVKISAKKNKFFLKFVNPLSNKALKITESLILNSYNVLPSTTSLCFALICEKIKLNKNKVILTGVGGDELFAGYYVNFLATLISYKSNLKKYNEKLSFWNQNIKKYIRNPALKNLKNPLLKKQKYQLNYYLEHENSKYLRKKVNHKARKLSKDVFYNNMIQNLFYNSIPAQNLQSDLVAMNYSIENRAPFMSHKIAEFVYSLNKDFFMYKGVPKSLLRISLKNKFPHEIRNNYEKTGFYAPFFKLFNYKEKKKIKRKLLNSKLLKRQIKFSTFTNLLNKTEKDITHSESKFLFGCLNLVLIEDIIKKNNRSL